MADQRIQYTDEMVGNGHPTKTDTLNKHANVEHNTDGTHKMTSGAAGDIYYHNGTQLTRLAKGTSGQVLAQNAGLTAPEWIAAPVGIAMAQQWRLTSDKTGNGVISANLEAIDTYGPGSIGSAMVEASGVFTFPSTGIYKIEAVGRFLHTSVASFGGITIELTIDAGSNWNDAAQADNSWAGAHPRGNTYASRMFDVTSVSNDKVRFSTDLQQASGVTQGDTNINETHFTFIRLGDT